MKKFLAAAAIVALASTGMTIGIVTPAAAISVSDFCKANGDLGLPSHGACVGGINKSVVQACKDARAALPPAVYEAAFGGTGLGACVSTIRHLIQDIP